MTSTQTLEKDDNAEDLATDFVEESKQTRIVKKVVAAGIFAALSIASAPIATYLPRLNWGIAWFDPVSLFWITAFLLAGPYVGFVSAIAGTIALFPVDPTPGGPLFKLLATLPMMFIPALAVREKESDAGKSLANPKFYFGLMVIASIVRIVIMVPINLVLVPILMGIEDTAFIINYTILINTLQAFWDALVPYFVIHKTPIFEHFRLW